MKFCGHTKLYDIHVVDVTKPILSVSCLCKQGVETHSAKQSCLKFGDGHEPLIRKGGVYFAKAQTVNACERADGCTEKTREYKLIGDQKTREYDVKGAQKKIDAYKLMDSQKIDEFEMTDAQKKTDEYEPVGAQNVRVDKSETSFVQTEKVQNLCACTENS